MYCPACKQHATSFLRNAFSMQGVSFVQSLQGQLRCQHCDALLRVAGYGNRFWLFYIPTIILLVVFTLFYGKLLPDFGVDLGLVWMGLLLVIVIAFSFGVWRNAQIEKVEAKTDPAK